MSGVAVDKELFDLLCCPSCRGDLDHDPGSDEMSCARCRHTYPVVDGIPVLFPMDVKPHLEALFGRYWDSEERAQEYDQYVEGTESMMGMHHHVAEVRTTLDVLGPLSNERLLDCGCGNGRFFEQYPKGVFTVGIDASLNLLRICKAKGRCERLVCCELEHLPFRDGVFDRTVSVRVLQHLKKQEEAVDEMIRVLRDGGSTVIHCYNDLSTKALAKRIRMSRRWQPVVNRPFRALHRSLDPFGPWPLDYDAYNTVPQLRRWLEAGGARVTRVRGTGFGFNKWLVEEFMVSSKLEREHPEWLRRYLALSLGLETLCGRIPPLSWVMEKFVIAAEKTAGPARARAQGRLQAASSATTSGKARAR